MVFFSQKVLAIYIRKKGMYCTILKLLFYFQVSYVWVSYVSRISKIVSLSSECLAMTYTTSTHSQEQSQILFHEFDIMWQFNLSIMVLRYSPIETDRGEDSAFTSTNQCLLPVLNTLFCHCHIDFSPPFTSVWVLCFCV